MQVAFALLVLKFMLYIETQPRVGAVIDAIRIFGVDIIYLNIIWGVLFLVTLNAKPYNCKP